ncbi:uncharacterized protein KGF55_004965 [Candida pseudojiufengensis]|uniref:uncharacterized protein n=1 Tax=Candida pseudojiufengensis TaxID=497109 RepID=UPI00222489F6|nr:uncharacterized protein KGF55_004965 [Candida pseudojiufengensis]KAI5959733.1 hypothetical protein KGF55_004965 [Candida pseudojiufengensis]
MNSTSSFKVNPLNKIIGLSVVLSVGFLLVILAGIYGNWFPIIIGLIFAVAHLPIVITKSLTNSSDYDFNFDQSTTNANIIVEFGQFLSSFLLVTGFYLPFILHHSLILTRMASILTIIGGLLIYATIYTFSHYFDDTYEDDGLADLGGGVI